MIKISNITRISCKQNKSILNSIISRKRAAEITTKIMRGTIFRTVVIVIPITDTLSYVFLISVLDILILCFEYFNRESRNKE